VKYPTQFEIRDWIDEAFRGLSAPVTVEKLKRRLRNNLFPGQIKWHTMTAHSFPKNEITVAGLYDQENDRHHKILMEIWLIRKQDPIAWTSKRQRQLRNVLTDCIIHELQHRRQARARRFKWRMPTDLIDSKKYLSAPDEIDAYAINVASEFYDSFKSYAIPRLGQFPALVPKKWIKTCPSPTLWTYLNEFEPNDPVVRKLVKKAYKHINNLIEHETRNNPSPHGHGKKLRQPKQGKTTQSRCDHRKG